MTQSRGAISGLYWALAQNWSSRVITLAIFVILARLLSPDDFGKAAAVILVVNLLMIFSELGYSDAIVQRRDLTPADVTLPFVAAMTVSVLGGTLCYIFSDDITAQLRVEGVSDYLRVACFVCPFVTLSVFQEAHYKRGMNYRALAIRTMFATCVSGCVGIATVLAGFGAQGVILQQITVSVVSAAWLWWRPVWKPPGTMETRSFVPITLFGLAIAGNKILDFVIVRSIDIVILSVHGPAALGLYTAGARIYFTALQVLTGPIIDFALVAASRMEGDTSRLGRSYLPGVRASALIASPLFIGAAAIAPEVTVAVFGPKWAASATVMMPMMLMGAIQCIQSPNTSYFSALGKPEYVIYLNAIKMLAVYPVLIFTGGYSFDVIIALFCLAQLVTTPLSYALIVKMIKVPAGAIVNSILPPLVICLTGLICVHYLRYELSPHIENAALRGIILAAVFYGIFAVGVLVFIRGRIMEVMRAMRVHGN